MKLAQILRTLLAQRKMKITQLSAATGVPVQTLHNWTGGQAPRNILHVREVARFFDVSLEFLLFGEETLNKSVMEAFSKDEVYACQFEVVLRRIVK